MNLTEFLTARLDEDEAAARAATAGPWTSSGPYVDGTGEGIIVQARYTEDATHIVRRDPGRVLREVEADRRLVSAYERAADTYRIALDADDPLHSPESKKWLDTTAAVIGTWEQAIKIRVTQFSDHPDYRPEWKP